MNKGVRLTLVAYDVPDDRRRTRMAELLGSYGNRVQFSVFMLRLSVVKTARLRRSLESLMIHGVDSVLMCDLGPADDSKPRYEFLGGQPDSVETSFII